MSRRFAEGLQHPADQLHARWRRFVDDDMLGRLLTPDAASARTRDVGQHITDLVREVQHAAPVDRLLYVDLKSYLCDNILTKVDRMSMAVSLEARVPYLDVDLVSLAFTVPAELKVTPMQRKVLLKEVARRRLPEDVVSRSKQGFSIPMKHWLKTRFRPIVEGYLNVDALRRDGLFNPETVDELRKAHLEGRADHSHLLWSLVVFQAWKRRWADTPAPEADS